MPPFRVSPQDNREAFINLNKGGFTVRLTAQELEQMKSVDIGAVSPESLPDVSGMTFDNALSRKERVTRFLQVAKNLYCFNIGEVGVKIEFAEDGPSLQDTLTDYLIRQKAGCDFGCGPPQLRDKVSRGGAILVVPMGQSYNISVM